jgi:plasmid stabilization system protein ParE
MDFKVIFRDTFLDDLELLVRSIAAHNPEAALRLGKMIIKASEDLSFFPERHPRVRQRPGIRRFIVRKYFKVFYRSSARIQDGGNSALLGWTSRS